MQCFDYMTRAIYACTYEPVPMPGPGESLLPRDRRRRVRLGRALVF